MVNKCSFQSGFCDWKNIADMDHKWKLSTGLHTLMNYTGVFVKHLKSWVFLNAIPVQRPKATRKQTLKETVNRKAELRDWATLKAAAEGKDAPKEKFMALCLVTQRVIMMTLIIILSTKVYQVNVLMACMKIFTLCRLFCVHWWCIQSSVEKSIVAVETISPNRRFVSQV